jgi:hypothetical protein
MNSARILGLGEPNKLCDLLAAGISEEYQRKDPESETRIHVVGGNGAIFVTGQVKSTADFDVSTYLKQAIGKIDPSLNLEPFINIDSVPSLPREALHTIGYAASHTATLLPSPVESAIGIARLIETARKSDDGWFWLSPDFDVMIQEERGKLNAVIRVSHIDSVSLEDIRGQVLGLVGDHVVKAVVNPQGADHRGGLLKGMGGSAFRHDDWHGSKLPGIMNGSGLELSHPANIGWMMARQLARELVEASRGRAVMTDLYWDSVSDTPNIIEARNERGEDLTSFVDPKRLSRRHVSNVWINAKLATAKLRFPLDGAEDLPWENNNLLQ